MNSIPWITFVVALFLGAYASFSGPLNTASGGISNSIGDNLPFNNFIEDKIGYVADNRKPNVVLITVETTPSYKLPCYGYERNTTYYWCNLAKNGTLYTEAYTSASYTPLTLTSIASGQYPFEIGMRSATDRVRTETKLLGNKLNDTGYSVYRSQQFSHIEVASPRYRNSLDEEVDRSALHELLENEERPVFYRDHISAPHDPYDPYMEHKYYESNFTYIEKIRENMKSFRRVENFSKINETYRDYMYDAHDEELRMTDRTKIRSILNSVRRSGEYDDTLIVIAADHGEMFGKHNFFGHKGPFDGNIKIPLIVKYPGQEESRVSEKLVSLIDIYPTVMDETGQDYGKEVTGSSLNSSVNRDYVFSQGISRLTLANRTRKVVVPNKSDLGFRLTDPGYVESRNGNESYVSGFSGAGEMEEYFKEYFSMNSKPSRKVSENSEEVRERLKGMGYLE